MNGRVPPLVPRRRLDIPGFVTECRRRARNAPGVSPHLVPLLRRLLASAVATSLSKAREPLGTRRHQSPCAAASNARSRIPETVCGFHRLPERVGTPSALSSATIVPSEASAAQRGAPRATITHFLSASSTQP